MSFLVGWPLRAHSHVLKAMGHLVPVAGWLEAGGSGFPCKAEARAICLLGVGSAETTPEIRGSVHLPKATPGQFCSCPSPRQLVDFGQLTILLSPAGAGNINHNIYFMCEEEIG